MNLVVIDKTDAGVANGAVEVKHGLSDFQCIDGEVALGQEPCPFVGETVGEWLGYDPFETDEIFVCGEDM